MKRFWMTILNHYISNQENECNDIYLKVIAKTTFTKYYLNIKVLDTGKSLKNYVSVYSPVKL